MRVVLTLVVIASAAAAGADEVWLKGGGRLVGDVLEKRPNAVVLDVGAGTVTLPLARVERIVSSTVALTEFRARAARLAPGDVPGWTSLAQWAELQDLRTLSREAWRRVVQADPGNSVAHLALGDVQYQGRWLDFASAQRARGLVEHDGTWMTPGDRAASLQRYADDAAVRRIAESQRREAEARVREAEARARTAEAEAERAEADASSDGIPFGYGGYGGWGVPVIGPVVPPCGIHGVGCPDRPGHGNGHGHGHGRPIIQPTPRPPAGDARPMPVVKSNERGAGGTKR